MPDAVTSNHVERVLLGVIRPVLMGVFSCVFFPKEKNGRRAFCSHDANLDAVDLSSSFLGVLSDVVGHPPQKYNGGGRIVEVGC